MSFTTGSARSTLRRLAAVPLLALLGACGSTYAVPDTGISGAPGSGAASDPEATIHVGSLYEPTNLSFVGGGGQGLTQAFYGNVYEALFRLNDDGSVEPNLAADVATSEDGLTRTVTIQEGVGFHSGKPLMAADVAASYDLFTNATYQSPRVNVLNGAIDSVEATDDSTVVFHLKAPWIEFEYQLSYVWVVNTALADLESEADGTGPYRFDDWKHGATLSLARFDAYWGRPARNGAVVFHYFTDASALANALASGDIDIIAQLQSPDSLAQFENQAQYTITDSSSTTKLLLAFNDKVAPFDDVRVRRAIYSAIDREKLLRSIWGDYGQLIGSMAAPTDPWYIDLTGVNPYDPELSRQLLDQAGLGDGFGFVLDTPTYDPHPTVAEFVQSELAQVGVKVEINLITADEWYERVLQGHDFAATLQEHVNDRDIDRYANPNFYFGWDDAEFQRLYRQSQSTATSAEQAELMRQANTRLAEQAASAWLYLYPQIVVAKSDLAGYQLHGLNSQFQARDIVKP
ncbi:MAG: ABC transporter substrate-binding protein [Propionibacteriaceae bacterium]|jgi:peptide/nickel transport system substrate-binding protein|nr:ABC transporter substrate-binding protein [Propionibacteriaceae bacterium]